MRHWAVVVPAERYQRERAIGDSTWDGPAGAAPGDRVAFVAAGTPPVVFGLGTVGGDGRVRYTRRLLDAPLPAGGLRGGPVESGAFAALEAQAGPQPPRRAWLVGVELPVEAESPADAVRRYWAYLRDLGPAELPAFVAPVGDELAMQAYTLDGPAALDPEED